MLASVDPVRDRLEPDLLVPGPDAAITGRRVASPDAFVCTESRASLRGARLLLVDDVYTTGAHAQSAAAALRRAGALVDLLVWGRRVNRRWLAVGRAPTPPAMPRPAPLEPALPGRWAGGAGPPAWSAQRWRIDRCPRCTPIGQSPPP